MDNVSPQDEKKLFINSAISNILQNEYKLAYCFLKKAQTLNLKHKDKCLVECLFGYIHIATKEYVAAIKHFTDINNNSYILAKVLKSTALNLVKNKQASIIECNESIQIYQEKLNNKAVFYAEDFWAYGLLKYSENDYANAIKYNKIFIKKTNYSELKIIANYNIAISYHCMKDFDNSTKYFIKVISDYKSRTGKMLQTSIKLLSSPYLQMITLETNKGNYKKAFELCTQAIQVSNGILSNKIIAELYQRRSGISTELKNNQQALLDKVLSTCYKNEIKSLYKFVMTYLSNLRKSILLINDKQNNSETKLIEIKTIIFQTLEKPVSKQQLRCLNQNSFFKKIKESIKEKKAINEKSNRVFLL